jgi:hypothetical protein
MMKVVVMDAHSQRREKFRTSQSVAIGRAEARPNCGGGRAERSSLKEQPLLWCKDARTRLSKPIAGRLLTGLLRAGSWLMQQQIVSPLTPSNQRLILLVGHLPVGLKVLVSLSTAEAAYDLMEFGAPIRVVQ